MSYKNVLANSCKTNLQKALDPAFIQECIDSSSLVIQELNDLNPKTIFKRPVKLLDVSHGVCSVCGKETQVTTHQPKKKRFTDIIRSVCLSGHVSVSIHQRLNPELIKSNFPYD